MECFTIIEGMPRYAAIDIGSNSVRMQAAEASPGNPPVVLASDREVTRLGSSVFTSGRISEEATAFVSQVLKRMGERYRALDVVAVRAVATSAVRDASNQAEFISRVSAALGAPVEIISGPEEARLIHLGVQSRWPHPKQRILVIDIGGGSAEFIVSDRGELLEGVSRPLGAVRLTEVFLGTDPPTPLELHRLEKFIDEKFEPAKRRVEKWTFDRVIGTSATAAAVVSAIHKVPRNQRDAADRLRARASQVRALYADLSKLNIAARRKTPGIGPRRAEIITAGAAVFSRVLDTLHLPSIYYSSAGVRDGIIADLCSRGAGRETLNKPQLRVLEGMCKKYSVDLRNARHVAHLAAELFHGFHPLHRLSPSEGKLLEAAAYLHNTGHFISDTGHHKHSAYVVSNSDMPGFTDQERHLIAMLCRYHRKSMPASRHDSFRALNPEAKRVVNSLTPLLRLAVGLDTGRQQKVKDVECAVNGPSATVIVRGTDDIDLELWAAERAGDSFRQIYGVPLTVTKNRRGNGL